MVEKIPWNIHDLVENHSNLDEKMKTCKNKYKVVQKIPKNIHEKRSNQDSQIFNRPHPPLKGETDKFKYFS